MDHADASAKVTHRVWSWSKERRETALAKCVVRCNPCHKKKSAGEQDKGIQHWAAKLTEADVHLIRESPCSLRKLAAQFDVDYTLIWQIKKRRIWQHI